MIFIFNYLSKGMREERVKLNDTKYRRVYRHLDYYLREALGNSHGFLTMEEIIDLLKKETDINFFPSTIRSRNREYIEEHDFGPLRESRRGYKYKLDKRFYKKIDVKPPQIYNARTN